MLLKQLLLGTFMLVVICACRNGAQKSSPFNFETELAKIESDFVKREIRYGKEIIDNTAAYIGPQGTVVKATGNYMSCKNCHLDSGVREQGLPFMDTHGLYPQFRSREGKVLTLAERINSCIRMPMLGRDLPDSSREMQAMLLYIKFLGANRKMLARDPDHRLPILKWPAQAASPQKGQELYVTHCSRCHQENGQGIKAANSYTYPPLWGNESYRAGSSMHRVSVLARFIKANMPFDTATPEKPVLTDEEALDIAAFINSEHINRRPPPPKNLTVRAEFKPFDFPEAPYADPFPPDQHKYGPFDPIIVFHKEKRKFSRPTDGDLNSP